MVFREKQLSIIYSVVIFVICTLFTLAGCVARAEPESEPEAKVEAKAELKAESELESESEVAEGQPLKVLFIGNSYTSAGNLPEVIAQMAKGKGQQIEYTAYTPGGRSLHKHWYEGKAQEMIALGGWDVVVLQDQSLNPAINPANMLKYAGLFCEKIDEVGAKKVFYLTFAYKDTEAWLGRLEESAEKDRLAKLLPKMQTLLNMTYKRAARENGGIAAPAGIAWEMAYSQNPKYPLHASDNSHPDKLGVYLTALVFYATLFDEMPAGMGGRIEYSIDNYGRKSVISVDDETRRNLEKIAWEAVMSTN